MDTDPKKNQYFSELNKKATRMLSRLFSVSMLLGAIIFFTAQSIVWGDYSLRTIIFCISIVVAGFIPDVLKLAKIKEETISFVIVLLMLLTYIGMVCLYLNQSGITVWTAAFIIIAVSMMYTDRNMLILSGSVIVGTLIYISITTPVVQVIIDPSNHVGRIGIVSVVLGISIYANQLFKKRIGENLDQIKEITEQKQEITELYEEITASEEELRSQIREIVEAHEKINRLAYYDELTDLPNRTLFIEKLIKMIDECSVDKRKFAVLYIDLDNFKKVNNFVGHKAGDLLLKKLAVRLKNVLEGAESLSHMGGDEFAVILYNITVDGQLEEKAQEILDTLKEPCTVNGVTHYISSSIGVAIYPQNGNTFEEILKNADAAMYKAKDAGKNNYKIFNNSLKDEMDQKLNLENNLRNALRNGEMYINYQPLLDSESGRVRGFEALMRWNSTVHGQISPDRFIPILEETGLILIFGEWIMQNACRQNKEWQDKYLSSSVVSINISPLQFMEVSFVEKVKKAIRETGIEPENLELEITESILIEDFYYVVEKLKELQSLGVQIALDDFGIGYSSLNYLRHLPINTLKIDKSFMSDFNHNNQDRSIIGSIVALAHDMQLKVVAEGVENEEQKKYLTEKKCDFLQGHYLCSPMNAESVGVYLLNHNIET